MIDPFPEKFFLAPMTEITTPALRRIIKDFTRHVVLYSEMISAGALVSNSGHNKKINIKYGFDDPYIYQIVGSKPEIMAAACSMLSETGCFAIDINMGCSAPDIVKRGAGAKLLTDIDRSREIIASCRNATTCNLSVKIRTGFDENNKAQLIDIVKMLEDEGVDFISVHPRYAKLAFRRLADWRLISFIRRHVSIPVIGNGDIDSPQKALSRLRETPEGVMIGREAVRSPWIFQLCNALLNNEKRVISIDHLEVFIRALDYITLYHPPQLHKSRSHRFCFYFSKNTTYAHNLFRAIRNAKTIDEIKKIVEDYYKRNQHERIKSLRIANGRIYEVDKI